MIFAIIRTAITGLRRDRASLALSFVLPIVFFSIFAVIFGGEHDTIPQVHLIVVDEDHSAASRNLIRGLGREGSLAVSTHPHANKKNAPPPPDYTAASAEAAVKAGDAPVALIIPAGWGQHPIAFRSDSAHQSTEIQLLNDQSDAIAPQIVNGLLQKSAMTAMPASMATEGEKYMKEYIGGLTPAQQKKWDANLAGLNALEKQRDQNPAAPASAPDSSSPYGEGIIGVHARGVVGEHQNKQMISFYAAAIGVMFLLFTASGSAGALLDEQDSGTLDRVLSSRVTMTTLLAGKLAYNTSLAFVQLVAMFLWGWAFFHLDFFTHIPGFIVMGVSTAFAVAAFGMLLASMCHTRAQLGAVSTLLILMMSALGGSMFPRFLMPEAVQKAGLFTINAWAIDGFTKVFWRDLPISALWPQVAVLLAVGIVFFAVARRIARRWEFS